MAEHTPDLMDEVGRSGPIIERLLDERDALLAACQMVIDFADDGWRTLNVLEVPVRLGEILQALRLAVAKARGVPVPPEAPR